MGFNKLENRLQRKFEKGLEQEVEEIPWEDEFKTKYGITVESLLLTSRYRVEIPYKDYKEPCMHYKAYLEDVKKGYIVDSYLKSGCDICKGSRIPCRYYTPKSDYFSDFYQTTAAKA